MSTLSAYFVRGSFRLNRDANVEELVADASGSFSPCLLTRLFFGWILACTRMTDRILRGNITQHLAPRIALIKQGAYFGEIAFAIAKAGEG